jgi:hypothetical protein
LRKDLERIGQKDHEWILKTRDQGGVAVVKLHCVECRRDIGWSKGDHSKTVVHNLFSNFKKNHMCSTSHVKSWCFNKKVDFNEGKQAETRAKKTTIMITDDHKRVVKDGIHIVDSMNLTVGCTQTLFAWIGADPESEGVKSYWYKVKCTICGDLMQLCPPKRQLESNLMAHINGTRHCRAVEEIAQKTTCLALTNGKRGRPSRSSANNGPTTKSLHNWFSSAKGHAIQVSVFHGISLTFST